MSPILKVGRDFGPIMTEVLSKRPVGLKSLYLRNHWELAVQISHGAGSWPPRSFKKVFLWKPEVWVGHIWLGRCIGGSNLRPSGPLIAILASGRRKVVRSNPMELLSFPASNNAWGVAQQAWSDHKTLYSILCRCLLLFPIRIQVNVWASDDLRKPGTMSCHYGQYQYLVHG